MRNLALFAFFLMCLCRPGFCSSNLLKLGTYNIRIISESDSLEKAWNNRKKYVAKIVKDNAYDAIGFQEIANSTQEKDLRDSLPDYTLVTWGRSSAVTLTGERVGVAYLTDKFLQLESGFFFLSTNPSLPLVSWDSNYSRITVYVKLQNKITGEIFYFFTTHLDNGGKIARREGAKINVQKMQEIAGKYPCFIVGDFNAGPSEVDVHNTFLAYYNDSRTVSQEAPVGSEGTYSGWSSANAAASKRIDYIYSNKTQILTYKTINENYNRSITPSDHFPLQITCTLNDVNNEHKIYVSKTGDDQNSGTKTSPLKTIQQAIEKASTCDTILVSEGVYYTKASRDSSIALNGGYINKSLTLIGGQNSSFSAVTGMTTISGDFNQNDVLNQDGTISTGNEDNTRHLIKIARPYRIKMENFILEGAYADESGAEGSAIQSLGTGISLDNVVIRNNYSAATGGGIYAEGEVIMNKCSVYNNTATNGAGIYLSSSAWGMTLTNSAFHNNSANSGSIAYIASAIDSYIYGCSFYENKCNQYGNFTYSNTSNTVSFLMVNNTFANNSCNTSNGLFNKVYGGSALYLYGSSSFKCNLVNNSIVGNEAHCLKTDGTLGVSFYGSAINMQGGTLNCYNNLIAGNYTTGSTCGDVYVSSSATMGTSQYNLYTSAEKSNIQFSSTDIASASNATGLEALSSTMEGILTDSHFAATLKDNGGSTPTISLLSKTFGNKNICILKYLQMSEISLRLDLNNNGVLSGYILVDQRAVTRKISDGSAIGATEFLESTGLNDPSIDKTASAYYQDGYIHISNNTLKYAFYSLYTINGSKLKDGCFLDGTAYVGHLQKGCYLVNIYKDNHHFTIKFMK